MLLIILYWQKVFRYDVTEDKKAKEESEEEEEDEDMGFGLFD